MIHKIKIGYTYSYSYKNELTPKMARNNRKKAVSYSVLDSYYLVAQSWI